MPPGCLARRCPPPAPVSYTHLDVYKRQVLVALLAGVLFVGSWLFALAAFLCLSLALYEELTALSRGGHYPVWWTSFAGLAISVPLMMFYSSLVIIPIPVSYTHLDVYKRQRWPSAGCRRTCSAQS